MLRLLQSRPIDPEKCIGGAFLRGEGGGGTLSPTFRAENTKPTSSCNLHVGLGFGLELLGFFEVRSATLNS